MQWSLRASHYNHHRYHVNIIFACRNAKAKGVLSCAKELHNVADAGSYPRRLIVVVSEAILECLIIGFDLKFIQCIIVY